MKAPPRDRRCVEAAVVSLQEVLAGGDPSDQLLRGRCNEALAELRAAYRADKALFSQETIDALRELSELLDEAAPAKEA